MRVHQEGVSGRNDRAGVSVCRHINTACAVSLDGGRLSSRRSTKGALSIYRPTQPRLEYSVSSWKDSAQAPQCV